MITLAKHPSHCYCLKKTVITTNVMFNKRFGYGKFLTHGFYGK